MLAQKRGLLANISNRRAKTAGIPAELLSRIFIEGYRINMFAQGSETADSDPTKYLLAISQVGGRWRAVATSTSALWVRIHIGWPLLKCRVWIARSGRRMLDIYGFRIGTAFSHSTYKNPPKKSGLADIFDTFRRWRSISLLRCTPSGVSSFFKQINDSDYDCDQLESIEVKSLWGDHSTYTDSLDTTLWTRIALEGRTPELLFPKLRSVTFWPVAYNLWGMLTHVVDLDLYLPPHSSWQAWLTTLGQAPALEKLRIVGHRFLHEENLPPIQLDSLRSLDIGRKSHHSFPVCWLRNVHAPNLCTLLLSVPRRSAESEAEIADDLSSFVSP